MYLQPFCLYFEELYLENCVIFILIYSIFCQCELQTAYSNRYI